MKGSGQYFFDYPNNKIYWFDDPVGRTIEAVTSRVAIHDPKATPVNNVTIKQMTVTKYGSTGQHGAIGGSKPGQYWHVDYVKATHNHGTGIFQGDGSTTTNSIADFNGFSGFKIRSDVGDAKVDSADHYYNTKLAYPILFKDNSMSYNHWQQYACGWEGGGVKLAFTVNAQIINNVAHKNACKGLWSSEFCIVFLLCRVCTVFM